jgi:hypothetical protein
MKIKKLKLYTNNFNQEKYFYSETLGLDVINESSNKFTLKVGWSELTFEKSEKQFIYHYCFLIPSNKLHQALKWMEKRVNIIDIENGRKTQRFENWNANSFYFYDASGNIAEFIVRHDLRNESNRDFEISDVLCVNEIGMPINNIENTNNTLQKNLGTEFWKGDLKRFGTNGSQEGLFLLPNYNIKDIWFPTPIKLRPEPFEAVIENMKKLYSLSFKNETIVFQKIKT